jgi:ureidoglycolate amidohydrolase
MVNADAPADCSPQIVAMLEGICAKSGTPYKKMVSRAYHDSLFLAQIAPIAMIFVPCRLGVSHKPDEYATTEDIARGAEVLAEALAELAAG